MIPTLYINRDTDFPRRNHIEMVLGARGFDATRISAVEGKDAGSEFSSALTLPERGCYASHLKAWRHMLYRDLPHALILEDDATLCNGPFWDGVDCWLEELPYGWDFIQLYAHRQLGFKPLFNLGNGHSVVRYSRLPSGCVGYLLSHKGAEKLLEPRQRRFPVDTDTRRPWVFGLDSYGIWPPVIHHADFPTTIPQRARQRRGVKLFNPLHTPRGVWFNLRKLGLGAWLSCSLFNLRSRLTREIMRLTPRRTAPSAIASR